MNEDLSQIDYPEVMEFSLSPLIIHTNLQILNINSAAEEFFRTSKENVIGASPLDIFKESAKSTIETRIQSAYQKPADVIEETIFRMDGTTVDVELYCHPLQIGDTQAIQTYVRDITARKDAERKQKEMSKQVNELSAAIVPILNGIAVLPLIGAIDRDRASQLLERIPLKAKNQGVKCLIIDFSGIYELDNVVIDYLFKITEVLTLLGVRSIITGFRPELAIVALQLDHTLDSIPTMATVKDALHFLGIRQS